MLKGEILVIEGSAINGFASSAIVIGEVASLAHERRNDPMEEASLVVKGLSADLGLHVSNAEFPEILGGLWRNI